MNKGRREGWLFIVVGGDGGGVFFCHPQIYILHQSVIQTALIQQEIIDTHNQHPIIIVIRYRRIFRNDNLFEEIARQRQ